MSNNTKDNTIYIDDGRRKINYTINGSPYSATVSVSQLLMPNCKVNNGFDFRQYVSCQLIDATDSQTKPTIEQVISQRDDFFIQIFDCCLSTETDFYAILNEIKSDEVCEHYIIAYCKYCMRGCPQASQQIGERLTQTISATIKMAADVCQSIDFSFINSLAEKINSAMSWYTNYAETILAGMKAALASFGEISQSILQSISESLQYIHIPELSDERKKELLESYKNWGKFGWTVPPHADIGCFNYCPKTLIEADKAAMQYCSKADMRTLFSEIEKVCTRKKDIREAISCYNSRQYKACALILFSIIDSRLIRLQRKNTEKYSVGAGAVAKYKDIVEQQTSDSGKLFLSLSYANLFPCLFTVFEDTKNFSKKTTVINRNYLDHGMSYKTVRKKDCIKLFLLLYNLLEFISIIKR